MSTRSTSSNCSVSARRLPKAPHRRAAPSTDERRRRFGTAAFFLFSARRRDRTMTNATAVIGAGSFGTALAIQLARRGSPTLLWGRDAEKLASMQAARENTQYLPEIGRAHV